MVQKNKFQSIPLEALRGGAALMVLVSHADHNGFVSLPELSVVQVKGFLGDFGVGLFFILSGFLIWKTAIKTLPRERGLRQYAVHRATRLMPLYYINVLAAAFLIPMWGSHFVPEVTFESLWRHITFTQDFSPQVSRSLNPVLWSLTHEMFFYVLVPVVFYLFPKRRLEWLSAIAILLSITSIRAYTGIFHSFATWFYLFVIGIVAAERVRERLPAWFALLVVCVFAVAVKAEVISSVRMVAMASAITVFICTLSIGDLRGSTSGFLTRVALWPLALVGTVSFSLYIWHYLLFNIVSFRLQEIYGWLSQTDLQILWLDELYRGISIIALSLMVAIVSYWLIEKPSMGILRQILLREAKPEILPLPEQSEQSPESSTQTAKRAA